MARRLALIAAATALAAQPAAAAAAKGATPVENEAVRSLMQGEIYVDPAVARLVDHGHLAYAARIASRAADGAAIKVAFVNVPDRRLDAFRDGLYERLRLGPAGAVVIATPTSVAMRTESLTPDQEAGIIQLDGQNFALPGRPYTDALAELAYDIGLVIHNSRPGAIPRGHGRDRNLSSFSGRFADEKAQRAERRFAWQVPVLGGAVALAFVLLVTSSYFRHRFVRHRL